MTRELVDDLRSIAERLREHAAPGDEPRVADPLARLEQEADRVAEAWSDLGYQSRVCYAELKPPPPGANSDSDWGFRGEFDGSTGDWREFDPDGVTALIYERAGDVDLTEAERLAEAARAACSEARSEVVSVLAAYLSQSDDPLIQGLNADTEKVRDLTTSQPVQGIVGQPGPAIVRDTTALSPSWWAAPHLIVGRIIAVRSSFGACRELAQIADRAAAHIERTEASARSRGQGAVVASDRVFIGHGRSPMWRELKDYVCDGLRLPWEEFNRVPVAGVTNIARLSEMLDNAGIAFVVLTAEDETVDGHERARQRVVHEAGLFQGRLGFSRAIVLLEEGCEEFSSIQELGQIPFPRGTIAAAFNGVRQVLEPEGFIDPRGDRDRP